MNIELTRLSEKGQVVIPSGLRKQLGLTKSDQFFVFGEKDLIILKKVETAELKNTLSEMVLPLQKATRQAKVTKKDLSSTLRALRNASPRSGQ